MPRAARVLLHPYLHPVAASEPNLRRPSKTEKAKHCPPVPLSPTNPITARSVRDPVCSNRPSEGDYTVATYVQRLQSPRGQQTNGCKCQRRKSMKKFASGGGGGKRCSGAPLLWVVVALHRVYSYLPLYPSCFIWVLGDLPGKEKYKAKRWRKKKMSGSNRQTAK